MVDGSDESLYYPDEKLGPNFKYFWYSLQLDSNLSLFQRVCPGFLHAPVTDLDDLTDPVTNDWYIWT